MDGHLHMFRHTFAMRQLHAGCRLLLYTRFLDTGACQQLSTSTRTYWLNTRSSLSVSVPEFWALIGHLTRVRLQNSGKSRSIYSAGWSSLVARRAHNPEVVGSNPTPATKLIDSQRLPGRCREAFRSSGKDSGKKPLPPRHSRGMLHPTSRVAVLRYLVISLRPSRCVIPGWSKPEIMMFGAPRMGCPFFSASALRYRPRALVLKLLFTL